MRFAYYANWLTDSFMECKDAGGDVEHRAGAKWSTTVVCREYCYLVLFETCFLFKKKWALVKVFLGIFFPRLLKQIRLVS